MGAPCDTAPPDIDLIELTRAGCETECAARSADAASGTAVCQFVLESDSTTLGLCSVFTPSTEDAATCAAASCTSTEIVCLPGAFSQQTP